VWYSLKNGWEVVVFSLKNKLLEGDARLSYENELPFHMQSFYIRSTFSEIRWLSVGV
jgi:hypothetical protein